ncbi:MAG: hypothetical protein KIT83_05480 [Bryobacterales bacterium]|nr:hypothetical protein [Bryobacterales bacterium]
MSSLYSLKEAVVASTPVLCFEFRFWDGHVERFASESLELDGHAYARRVVAQQLHENSLGGDDAIGYYARIGLTLANADGLMAQIEKAHGFRGAQLLARFVFLSPDSNQPVGEPMVVFRGIADAPSLVDEMRVVLAAENRFALFHAKLPATPIQRRCPWHFPYDAETRQEAATGGDESRHSLFYRCGYSPEIIGGTGSLDGGAPFTSCRGTREECAQRGMLSADAASRSTRRFGGFTFLPASILVRTHGSRSLQAADVQANQARGNDVTPLVYGRGWLAPPLIHSINDGNLTRLLYLLADGEVDGIDRVVVNGVEIPAAVEGRNMTASGWHRIIASGTRNGSFLPKPDNDGVYTESDPHGSMATIEVVIPNAIQKGSSQPRTEVLLRGMRLLTVAADGSEAGRVFTDNPAWVLLDILLRSGWRRDELHLPSFATAAQHCTEPIQAGLWNGTTQTQPRFSCNLVIQKRRSVGEILRGLREASFLFLRERFDGRLEAVIESTLALQQPIQSELSNAAQSLQGGWPVYEFGDGTAARGGILRSASGAPSFRMFSRGAADSPNRIHAEFQDVWNEFQADRISLFDSREIRRTRQEIAANSRALGLSTYHQAARAVYAQLKRATAGNRYVEFETGLRGIGIRPGDLITVTYARHGLQRQPFRVLRVRPAANLESAQIVAQWHEDAWYADAILEELGGLDRYRNPAGIYGTPRSLAGALVQPDGSSQFDVAEVAQIVSDGVYRVSLQCGFLAPTNRISATLAPPLASLTANVQAGGGTLPAGTTYSYCFSSLNADGEESATSSPVAVSIPSVGTGYGVQITSLSAPPEAAQIRVYRGTSPGVLYAIATLAASATSFTDTGFTYQPMVPPDPHFHHANFYWRAEVHPAVAVDAAGAARVTHSAADWQPDQFQGKLVWIVNGKGKAQQRTVLSNNANTLFVEPWTVVPDITSIFAIAEPTWQLGTKTSGSPAAFEVPNLAGSTVQLLGVSANALDLEAPVDQAVVTRWQIGGGSVFPVDTAVPGEPFFSLAADGAGTLLLSGIGFESLANTTTIQSGTLQVCYYDELRDYPTPLLASGADALATELSFTEDPAVFEGAYLQLGREVMRVSAVNAGHAISVERGVLGTVAAEQPAGQRLFALSMQGMSFAVPLQFFGSPASSAFRQSFYLPHARVAAANLVFTNSVGTSPEGLLHFTPLTDFGLRTGYGGQYALYVEGYLAIEDDAAVPLIVDRDHSVRDVFATLESPPTGGPVEIDLLLDGDVYCSLTFAQGAPFSNVVNGVTLPPLRAGARLTVNVRSVVHYGNTIPGKDLSIRIRL